MIVTFNGISGISRAIRWFGDGEESHVAWVDDELGTCWEAWTSGVRQVLSIHHQHTAGTVVDLWRHKRQQHHHTTAIRQFFLAQEGKPYDWPGILRFVTRGKESNPDDPPHWFCSRLVAAAHRKAGLPILNAPDWKIMPTHVEWSTELEHAGRLETVESKTVRARALHGVQLCPEDDPAGASVAFTARKKERI
jgi:hypothetical protein